MNSNQYLLLKPLKDNTIEEWVNFKVPEQEKTRYR